MSQLLTAEELERIDAQYEMDADNEGHLDTAISLAFTHYEDYVRKCGNLKVGEPAICKMCPHNLAYICDDIWRTYEVACENDT